MNIADMIRKAGLRPIADRWSYNANDIARDMMSGRTHYYEKDTMRYFHCRVQLVRNSENGVFMATIATQASDFRNTSREYRIVAHDLTGYCLERSDLGSFTTRRQADKAFAALWVSLDEKTVLREAIKREKERKARELADLRSVRL